MILLNFLVILTFLGPNRLFLGVGEGLKTIVEQLSFSMFPSILIDFDLTLGPFLTYWGPNGLLLGLGWGSTTVLGSTHVVEKLSFSMLP